MCVQQIIARSREREKKSYKCSNIVRGRAKKGEGELHTQQIMVLCRELAKRETEQKPVKKCFYKFVNSEKDLLTSKAQNAILALERNEC